MATPLFGAERLGFFPDASEVSSPDGLVSYHLRSGWLEESLSKKLLFP